MVCRLTGLHKDPDDLPKLASTHQAYLPTFLEYALEEFTTLFGSHGQMVVRNKGGMEFSPSPCPYVTSGDVDVRIPDLEVEVM